jgi:hypothetical protein
VSSIHPLFYSTGAAYFLFPVQVLLLYPKIPKVSLNRRIPIETVLPMVEEIDGLVQTGQESKPEPQFISKLFRGEGG